MSRLLRASAIACLSLCLCGAAQARSSITGVCPDGSMFIVKEREDIPCPDSKEVDPHDLPPIRPEYLPRPYGWQVFQTKQDPNNPYNLVDRAQTIREAGQPIDDNANAGTGPPPVAPVAQPEPEQHAALPPVAATPPATPAPLRVSDQERRDLALIVELSQQKSAARFASEGAPIVVELAYSRAFEQQVRAHFAGDSLGPVVLFNATARDASAFHANFTFVQGHAAFHPRPGDPRRMGVLSGGFGALEAGDNVLGYVVLPAGTDLSQAIDIYWDDRRISAALSR